MASATAFDLHGRGVSVPVFAGTTLIDYGAT
jgi:hypothetical protein